MTSFDYDLFTIGIGSGGTRASRIAAGHGAKVAAAEAYRIGGTCVIRGCVPKKLMVYASHFASDFADAEGFGWTVKGATFDWHTLIANKDREIARLSGAYRKGLETAGVAIFEERATITGPNNVRLSSGQEITARTILIATGGKPWLPDDLPGIEHTITSNEVFHLPKLPKRVIVAGGGYIALEFACIFRGLGAEVTLVYRGDQILRGFDGDVRAHLRREMEAKGIRVITNAVFTGLEDKGGEKVAYTTNGLELRADCILMAVGRVADTDGLGLERAGVETVGEGRAVKVDHFSRSSVPSIYAVGDVTNRINLTPVAIREGHAFADTVFGGKPTSCDHSDVPTAVFTTPEIGTVGLSEEMARKGGHSLAIYKSVFRPMKHTLSGRETRTLMKLVVDAQSDRVLGCHIVGADAAEMIQCVGIAIKMKATKADFDATMALHPSAAEELVTMRTRSA
ncbi:MAG TPA: glutathione-disulfide reductase [Alphaproteobacteria bacterium]|nr:glutathione-disulfide reductase [Alphaproteobacteria bacterium]HAJ45993.1 glutathione-disulfide reductase [Alphaproteobacteria bacterium]